MTEKDAIKIIKEEKSWESDNRKIDAFILAIDALEKIQQYREIGTLEECRVSMEKQKPHKWERGIENDVRCPFCGTMTTKTYEHKYCSFCGQRLER